MSNNQLFTAFIKWLEFWFDEAEEIRKEAGRHLTDEDTTLQEALNYFIDLYDSITQQEK